MEQKVNYLAGIKSIHGAILYSEILRTKCMLLILSFVSFIGLFRIASPISNSKTVGLIIFSLGFSMFLFELFMLRFLESYNNNETNCRYDKIKNIQITLECLFPIFVMFVLAITTDIDPYLLLVSPAYGLIMIMLAASVLRLDIKSTIICGILCSIGYALFLFYIINYSPYQSEPPYPIAMYINLTVMLIFASLVAVFITKQMRHYLDTSLEEVEIARKHELLQRDLDIAEEIQQSLLPESSFSIKDYELAGFSRPAEKAGGDYYDWRLVEESRLLLSVADVSGHGIGPALVTTACRAYVRAILDGTKEIEKLINKVNGLLHEDMPSGKFVTFGLLDLNLDNHEATFLSAGHAPHLFIKGSTGKVDYIEAQGVPFGVVDKQDLDKAVIYKLEQEDLLIMFTDGVYEVSNNEGKQLGLNMFVELIVDNRDMMVKDLVDLVEQKISEFLDGSLPNDDMTMVVLKRS
jgi:serine phosphatase RsbU (regulator of sigma subunit)